MINWCNSFTDCLQRTFLRKVFSLPFLPADHIPPAFEKLKEKSTDEKTQEIMQYWRYKCTWMTSTVWTVPTWSVFNQSIRTNNDVEGSHHKLLNRKARKGNLQFFLITLKQKDCRHRWRWSPRGNSKDTDAKGAVPSRASCFKCGRSTTATKSARIISWRSVV
jgi:hypothetical protein